MAIIVIKDLPESIDLDRQAMLAITGGARVRGRPTSLGRAIFSGTKIVQSRLRRMTANTSPKRG